MTFGFRSLAASVALAAVLCATGAQAGSIRFFGHGTNDIDRVKIRIDDPALIVEPPRPADVGGNFTIEFWVKGVLADNNTGNPRCGNEYGWINGHIILDRDRFSQNGAFGISISRLGWVAFGANSTNDLETVCGTTNVLDGAWHHVAVTRTTGGQMRLFVDGVQEATSNGGPTGDISYPDDGVPRTQCGAAGNQSCNFSDPFIVLGAEKHDVAPASAPSFDGFMDELRISSVVRYTANFTPGSTPFVSDANTAGLYHFDEATSGSCATNTVITDSATGLSPGFCSFGGSAPAGPVWSSDTPFTSTSPGTLQLQAAIFSGAEGGGAIRINATRVSGTDGTATVNYTTTNGTALAGSDYTTASGVLSWNAGAGGTQFFDITILDDTVSELAETLTVTLSSPSGATLGTPSTATVTINDDDNNGTLQLSSATYSVSEEAGPLTVTAQRIGGSDGAVMVDYGTSDGTAQAGADYTAASGTLNWANGDATSKSFAVTMLNDTELDTGETFTVTLSNPAGGATLGAPSVAIATITDSDSQGTLQFTAAALGVTEGSGVSAVLQVSRIGGNAGAASVRCTPTDGTALAPGDYNATPVTLNWTSGDATSKSCSIPIVNDNIDEGATAETFGVTLSLPTGASLGTQTSATVSITDDDDAGNLQLSAAAYSASEDAGSLTVTVRRMVGGDGPVSVSYATSNGTALAGSEYTATSGTLTWADQDVADKTFAVPILNDNELDDGKTFTVAISGPTGNAVLGSPATATATIADSDVPGTLQFTVASLGVTEGVGASALLQVSRTGGSAGAASVRCTTSNGSALTPGDYTHTDVTLTWASGDTASKSCTIPIANDAIDEGATAETFGVALTMATGATLGTPTSATVSITDDDDAGTLRLSAAGYSASEDGGSLTISVQRTLGADGPVAVNYATSNGTALAGSEYTNTSGTLNWADQEMADKTFAVPILNDTEPDDGKTFSVAISGPTGNAVLGTPATATVTIDDSDTPGTLQFALGLQVLNEDAGTVQLQVTRVGGNAGAASVRCTTANGTALAGLDYTDSPDTLDWTSGDSGPKACVVTIVDDSVDEIGPDETFTATLGNANGATIAAPATTVLNIRDNDPTTGALQFSMNGFTVVESDGLATITVVRVGGTETAVSVQYSTTAAGSTATAGQDYTPTSGTLQWNNGDGTSREFQVQIVSDTNVEEDETVRLQLTNFFGATPGNPVNTALTIVNDDVAAPGALIFSSPTYNVGESAGSVTVTVRRIGGDSGNASVNYSTSNGTATSPADYTTASGQLMWANGDATDRTLQIPINDDGMLEGAETFNIQLSNASGAVIGSIGSASISIGDDDVARPGSLQLAQSNMVVAESGGAMTVEVTRTGGTDGAVSVTVTAANGSAIAGSDFGFQNTPVSWAAGEGGSKSVAIQIIDDSGEEPDENFTLSLINVAGGATIGTPSSATVTISSNDVTTSDRSNGGGAIQWWMLLLGLLPTLRALRPARF